MFCTWVRVARDQIKYDLIEAMTIFPTAVYNDLLLFEMLQASSRQNNTAQNQNQNNGPRLLLTDIN